MIHAKNISGFLALGITFSLFHQWAARSVDQKNLEILKEHKPVAIGVGAQWSRQLEAASNETRTTARYLSQNSKTKAQSKTRSSALLDESFLDFPTIFHPETPRILAPEQSKFLSELTQTAFNPKVQEMPEAQLLPENPKSGVFSWYAASNFAQEHPETLLRVISPNQANFKHDLSESQIEKGYVFFASLIAPPATNVRPLYFYKTIPIAELEAKITEKMPLSPIGFSIDPAVLGSHNSFLPQTQEKLTLTTHHKGSAGSQKDTGWILIVGFFLAFLSGYTLDRLFQVSEQDNVRISNRLVKIAQEESYKASKAKSHFLTSMSHEIRTPITTIIGVAGILKHTDLTSDQKDLIRSISLSSEHLQAVIGDILDFSRMDANKLELDAASFSLIQTLEESFAILSSSAYEKGLSFYGFYSGEFPSTIVGDPIRLKQILVNLLTNAIKFTKAGEVVVDVRIHYDSSEDGKFESRLSIRVTDTGVGIAKNRRNDLFRQFSKANSLKIRSEENPGTGLGLTISKKLSKLMGGTIVLEDSEEGKGSTFLLSLPLKSLNFTDSEMQLKVAAHLAIKDQKLERHIKGRLNLLGIESTSLEKAEVVFSDSLSLIKELNPSHFKHQKTLVHLHSFEIDPVLRKASEGLASVVCSHFLTHREIREILQLTETHSKEGTKYISKKHSDFKQDDENAEEDSLIAGSKVLIAEDNKLNRQVIKRMLSNMGCDVDEAEDGKIALDMILSIEYDIVILDMHMPNLSGIETCERAREKLSPEQHLPTFIALTADATSETAKKSFEVGFDELLLKPIQARQMKKVIAFHLKQTTSFIAKAS